MKDGVLYVKYGPPWVNGLFGVPGGPLAPDRKGPEEGYPLELKSRSGR